MLKELTLENLVEIDEGMLKIAFERHLHRLVSDLKDRPGEEKPRKLTMTVELRPISEVGSDQRLRLREASVGFDFKVSMPTARSNNYTMKPVKGGLAYNDTTPENPDQQSILDAAEQEESIAN